MGIDADLARTTATRLLAGLRNKSYSACELTEACISRIEALDGQINAVVVRDFERARADARAADEAIARGESKPLLGLPMTVKESYDLRGYPTTWGMEAHRDHRAREDALPVQRLKAAGAIVLGKTNVPPVLADWMSDNPIYGRTNNPYSLGHSPGGSSGGSAAALAMGFSALEMGSDIGGSIRIPAAFCGVFGHKPTWGIIPAGGHAAGGIGGVDAQLTVRGPMARSAQDLDLALGVVAGPDADSFANRLALPPPRHDKLENYRVFVLDQHPVATPDSDTRHAIDALAEQLTEEGASVARSSSLLPDLAASWRTYQAMLHTINTRRSPTGRPPISAHEWFDRLDEQQRLRRQWADFFRHFDVVIAPCFSTPAFPHTDEPDWRKRSILIDGEPTNFGAQLAWPGIATVANLPATATPLGLNAQGLPLSCQIIGPHLEDRTTIHFAGRVAKDMPPPKLAM